MKNVSFFTVFALAFLTGLVSPQFTQSQKIYYADAQHKAGFTLSEQSRGGVSVAYSVASFTISPAVINGKSVSNIEMHGSWLPNDEGAPNLPGGGKYIAIPQGSTPVLRIVSQRTESYRDIEVAPAPKIPLETDVNPLQYPTRTDIYSQNAFYPAAPVTLSEPQKIRGVDVVMLGVTPFQYNPVTKELVVYRDLEIEIDCEGGNGQFGENRLRNRYWDAILEDAVFNHNMLPKIDYGARAIANRSNDGCDYLIIVPDNDEYMDWAEELQSFRIKQGVTTEIRTLTEVGGNSAGIIESFINNIYYNWDPVPAAVLLMGDYGSNQTINIMAPIWDSYCVSDNIYADVDQDDMPDIIFARMVANNTTELETFVTKIINYETNPPTNYGFYDHPITALGWQTSRWFQICSETVGGYFKNVHGKNPVRINEIYQGNPGSDPWSTATNTQTILDEFGPQGLGYIPATPQELGNWSGGNASNINNAINSGAFILQHRDHGAETGWGEPAYSNGDINGLQNTDLTYIFSINCLTGKYNYSSECFVEKFHRYRYNGVNSGALGVTGASEVSYSFVNDTYVWGLFDNMWPDFMPEYGSTPSERGLLPAFGNAAGKYFLKQSSWPYNTENKEVTYNLFHHFGDAFQTLYSEVPQDLTVIHDGIILAGLNEITISADEGSSICLTVGNDIIGLAEGTGNPEIVTITPQTAGTIVTLTITKTNYFRHIEEIQVIPAEGPYCLYGAHSVTDENGGNGNGLTDYNETISLNLGMRNVGLSDGENVTVTISTSDPFIIIIDDEELYGTIPSGQTVTIDSGFTFYVAENTPDQHKVYFDVISSDGEDEWPSMFIVKVNAPILNINTLTVNDQTGGNGNGVLDPGEEATMTLNYSNSGHAVAYDVDLYLEGQSGFIEILNPEQNFASIGFFGTFNKVFDVVVDEDAPEGIVVNFVNEMTMGNYFSSKLFKEKICPMIEDFETGNFSKYDWVFPGNQPWTTSLSFPYQGLYSATSGTITANQNSEIKITYDVLTNDSISFIRKVSSEPGDKLAFYINSTKIAEWSGTNEGWRRESFAVSPGNKSFRWVYSKNSAEDGGSDKAWIDNIYLPSPLTLTIWAGPDAEICPGDGFQITESYGTDFTSIEWTSSGNGSFSDNTQLQPVYTPSTEDMENGSVNLTMTLSNTEGNVVTDEMTLTFTAAPEAPPAASGPEYVDLFEITTSDYMTEGIPDILEYNWYLDPVEAGTIESSGMFASVTWNPAYLGTAYITVTAVGPCSEGEFSEPLAVMVDNTVGLGENDGRNNSLSLFPNPGHGYYELMLETEKAGNISLKVYNATGKLVYEQNRQISGLLHENIDLQQFPNGVYFLKVEGDGLSIARKLVKE
jgi:hypothetical protein